MKATPNILLVGYGNMGRALARGWLAQGIEPRRVFVADQQPDALRDALAAGFSGADALGNDDSIDVLLLAVKPQHLDAAVDEHRASIGVRTIVVSIVAGKRLAQIEALTGSGTSIVRAMPNTPAAIGRGITVMCPNTAVNAEQRMLCEDLLAAVGEVHCISDERMMNAVTAVSGSGPAYVFLLIEALVDAGTAAGLPRDLAGRLALATVAGAGAYAAEAKTSAAELRRRVTSPGGTTEAALRILMGEGGLTPLLRAAVLAANARAEELSSD